MKHAPCPVCGGGNLKYEKRPNGDTTCVDCGYKEPSRCWPEVGLDEDTTVLDDKMEPFTARMNTAADAIAVLTLPEFIRVIEHSKFKTHFRVEENEDLKQTIAEPPNHQVFKKK